MTFHWINWIYSNQLQSIYLAAATSLAQYAPTMQDDDNDRRMKNVERHEMKKIVRDTFKKKKHIACARALNDTVTFCHSRPYRAMHIYNPFSTLCVCVCNVETWAYRNRRRQKNGTQWRECETVCTRRHGTLALKVNIAVGYRVISFPIATQFCRMGFWFLSSFFLFIAFVAIEICDGWKRFYGKMVVVVATPLSATQKQPNKK